MLDDFLNIPPLEDGDTEDLGDHLNSSFGALQVAGNLSFRFQGDWDSARNYKLNDEAYHSGSYWHVLAANINSEPAPGNTNWRVRGGASADANQNANLVKAGPASGSAAAPTYRALVAADLPALNGLAAPTGDLTANGHKITNLAAPTSSNDAARKADVDAAQNGLSIKEPVRVATIANITLSAPQTIDGIVLIVGDRVLVKNQTTGADNGIYVVAAGAWSRAADADTSGEVVGGTACWVNEGTTNADKRFTLTTNNPITLGTTSLAFVQDSAAGGVSSVNSQSGTVTLDDSNVNAQDPSNGATVSTLRTVLSNLWTAIQGRATGAASSTDNSLPRFDGTGGKTLQTSAVTLSDLGAFGIPDQTEPVTTTGLLYATSGVLKWAGRFLVRFAGAAVTSDFLKADSGGNLVAATMATGKLLGRSTAATGAIEEISLGAGLALSGGTLRATADGLVYLQYGLDNQIDAVTTGTAKLTVPIDVDFTLSAVKAYVATLGSAGITVDINKNSASVLSTKLTVDTTEHSSSTAAVPAVISSSAFAAGDVVSFDIDATGTGVTGITITLIGVAT